MKFVEPKFMIEALGILAVVLSLLFVGFELRLARSVAESEDFTANIELSRGLAELIASNSDVWVRGCVGEELTTSEDAVFRNIAISIIGHRFSQWGRSRTNISAAAGPASHRRLAANIYNFPGLKAVWDGGAYSSREFREAVNEQYNLLFESGAERNMDTALCGR